MTTYFLKQASSFLQEKYKSAKLALTDVTQAELLAEEATNSDPWGPDAKTMTRIAEASFGFDDYWRIVDVLHRRLYSIDWKEWRQSYKTLVLLEFLLTHGPEEFAQEFQCHTEVIEELSNFKHIDEKGFNWGVCMQKKSEHIIELLGGGARLKEARLKALKITKEIQGFGSSSSSSSPHSLSSETPMSSFGTYSPSSSTMSEFEKSSPTKDNYKGTNIWDCHTIDETGSLLDSEDEEDDDEQEKTQGFINGICSKFVGVSPSRHNGEIVAFRTLSDVGRRAKKKKFDRQVSLGS